VATLRLFDDIKGDPGADRPASSRWESLAATTGRTVGDSRRGPSLPPSGHKALPACRRLVEAFGILAFRLIGHLARTTLCRKPLSFAGLHPGAEPAAAD
jgi:hypothetical protein